jgi:COMPASS component SWD2
MYCGIPSRASKCCRARPETTLTYRQIRMMYSKKYGIAHARFTHSSKTILHASTKGDDHAIRYNSLHDNRYLKYFQGHTAR